HVPPTFIPAAHGPCSVDQPVGAGRPERRSSTAEAADELVCVEGREVVAEAEGAVLVAFAPQQGEELLRHAAVTVPLGGMAHLVARGKPDAVRAALTASHSSLDAIRHVKPGACVCRHANV